MIHSQPRSTSYSQTRAFSRAEKNRAQSAAQLRFHQVIQNYAKHHPVKLNLPETIIQGFGLKKPTSLRTNTQGLVVCREGLSTPEYCPNSMINILLTFSSQGKKPGIPCAIVKQEISGRDLCLPLMTLKAGQMAWNRMLSQFQPIVIQRYLYNGTPCAFVLRVRYQPTLSHVTFQILQNNLPVARKTETDQYLELAEFLDKSALKRSRYDFIPSEDSTADRFLVRTTTNLSSYEYCQISPIDSVRAQVDTIKTILEKGLLAQFDLSVLELQADFCQDSDAKWYFISLHSYKTELAIKRTLPFANAQKMMTRLVTSKSQLQRVSSTPALKPRLRVTEDVDITAQSLLSEIMCDLGVRRL